MPVPLPGALAAIAREARAWLFDDLLPLWAEAGRDPAGGFHDQLDEDARPLPLAPRCRVQARQVYVFAAAGRMGWPGDWRGAMAHGLRFLLDRFDRDDFFACRLGPGEEARDNYEQAFVLFALAHAYRATGEEALRVRARRLLAALRRERGHPLGGFHESAPPAPPLRANPHMHLFEAAIAWADAAQDPAFLELGRELAALAGSRMRHGPHGALVEQFDLDWWPLAGEGGRLVEPGHQFEWAWLFTRWSAISGEDHAATARDLYAFAAAHGVDHARGVALNVIDPTGAALDRTARLWPQTERIKAALAMRALGDAAAAQAVAEAWTALKAFRLPGNPALFRDKMREDSSFADEPAFASSLYHITCAVEELDRMAKG